MAGLLARSFVHPLEPNGGRAGIDRDDELRVVEEEKEPIREFAPVIADGDGIDAGLLKVGEQLARAQRMFGGHIKAA
jgi:hypothetical protein